MDCPNNGNFKCVSCDEGYQLFPNNRCSYRKCQCFNGSGSQGVDCPSNGAFHCSSCNFGYYLSGIECLENVCTCSGGTGAVGPGCPGNGQEFCTACNNGFSLQSNLCVQDSPAEDVNVVNDFLQTVGVDNSDKEVAITLYWTTSCDMDLHVVEPDNEEIYYAHMCNNEGTACLDVDMSSMLDKKRV